MADKKYLIPRPGTVQRSVGSGEILPADGGWVTIDAAWRRRLRDGDVAEGQPGGKPAPKATTDPAPDAAPAPAEPGDDAVILAVPAPRISSKAKHPSKEEEKS